MPTVTTRTESASRTRRVSAHHGDRTTAGSRTRGIPTGSMESGTVPNVRDGAGRSPHLAHHVAVDHRERSLRALLPRRRLVHDDRDEAELVTPLGQTFVSDATTPGATEAAVPVRSLLVRNRL